MDTDTILIEVDLEHLAHSVAAVNADAAGFDENGDPIPAPPAA